MVLHAAVSFLSEGSEINIQVVIELEIVPIVVQLLQHPNPSIQVPLGVLTQTCAYSHVVCDRRHRCVPLATSSLATPSRLKCVCYLIARSDVTDRLYA